jgi:hypothetical protein
VEVVQYVRRRQALKSVQLAKRGCQLDITCSSPLVLAVPNGVWAVIAAYKLPEQSPTLLLKQLTQIYEYTHISRLLYAYCTPVTATVKGFGQSRGCTFINVSQFVPKFNCYESLGND